MSDLKVLHSWEFFGHRCCIVETEPGCVKTLEQKMVDGRLSWLAEPCPMGIANEVIRLRQLTTELATWLDDRGEHMYTCAASHGTGASCDCGRDDLLERAKEIELAVKTNAIRWGSR